MPSLTGEKEWIASIFGGKITPQKRRAAENYHRDVLHFKEQDPFWKRFLRTTSEREAVEKLGMQGIRELRHTHQPDHTLTS